MKPHKIALIAIGLWFVSVAVFAWFFIHGNITTGTDNRTAVVLKADERELILREMRTLLAATQNIMEGLNQNDMALVSKSAYSVGMGAAADIDPALMAKLPLQFKSQGMGVHQEMDEIANAAEAGKAAPEIFKMLTSTVAKCVACHAAWQLSIGN